MDRELAVKSKNFVILSCFTSESVRERISPIKNPCTSNIVKGQSSNSIISSIRSLVEFFIEKQCKLIILLINVVSKTILYSMSDIIDKLNSLKENVDNLNQKIDSTNLENKLLKNQQSQLVSEKSELIKKNETAKVPQEP